MANDVAPSLFFSKPGKEISLAVFVTRQNTKARLGEEEKGMKEWKEMSKALVNPVKRFPELSAFSIRPVPLPFYKTAIKIRSLFLDSTENCLML